MSYRFFGDVSYHNVTLVSDDIFHLTKVLRIRIGEQIEVVSNNLLHICTVTALTPLAFTINETRKLTNELPVQVTLIYALPKADKLELVLQKAVELGVSEIIITNSRYSVMKIKEEQLKKKIARYQSIIKSAAMQAKRDVLPPITYVNKFSDALTLGQGLKLFAYEKDTDVTFNALVNEQFENVTIVIGSEGGFSEEEVNLAMSLNYTPVTFGPLIFRTETAAIYALSVLYNALRSKK